MNINHHTSTRQIREQLLQLPLTLDELPADCEVERIAISGCGSTNRPTLTLSVASFNRMFAGREVGRDDPRLWVVDGDIEFQCYDYSLAKAARPRTFVVPAAKVSDPASVFDESPSEGSTIISESVADVLAEQSPYYTDCTEKARSM